MKKVIILLTIILISCGSEEGTAEVVEETEEVEVVEEKSKEVVKEIVVLGSHKKPENYGISDEDFYEYLKGLEDYPRGSTFVPIPLKLDEFKPFTESGNCLSDDVTIIEPREYIYMLIEAYWSAREDLTYGYISESGNQARNGPTATLAYEKLVAINSQSVSYTHLTLPTKRIV